MAVATWISTNLSAHLKLSSMPIMTYLSYLTRTDDITALLVWCFSKNHEILKVFEEKYRPDHGYWEYLNQLISDLVAGKCEGIQVADSVETHASNRAFIVL